MLKSFSLNSAILDQTQTLGTSVSAGLQSSCVSTRRLLRCHARVPGVSACPARGHGGQLPDTAGAWESLVGEHPGELPGCRLSPASHAEPKGCSPAIQPLTHARRCHPAQDSPAPARGTLLARTGNNGRFATTAKIQVILKLCHNQCLSFGDVLTPNTQDIVCITQTACLSLILFSFKIKVVQITCCHFAPLSPAIPSCVRELIDMKITLGAVWLWKTYSITFNTSNYSLGDSITQNLYLSFCKFKTSGCHDARHGQLLEQSMATGKHGTSTCRWRAFKAVIKSIPLQ